MRSLYSARALLSLTAGKFSKPQFSVFSNLLSGGKCDLLAVIPAASSSVCGTKYGVSRIPATAGPLKLSEIE